MDVARSFAHSKLSRAVAIGSVALAVAGIVLIRGEHSSQAHPDPTRAGDSSAEFHGPWVHGSVGLSQSRITSHGNQHLYAELRIGAESVPGLASAPVAMAVVLDVSGSMSGEKLEQAKAGVLQLVEGMRDADEISLVTYDDTQTLVQALAPLSEVRGRLRAAIPLIHAGGGTVIPDAIAMGASTLQAAPESYVRRIVLVSDGEDGSGRPLAQIEDAVRERAQGGVTLSSLGVGADYDERFMTGVADAGRGNYEFLGSGSELAGFLARELHQATATVVANTVADITLPEGWHLVRAFGAAADVRANHVLLPIGSLSAGDERRVVLTVASNASTVNAPPVFPVAVSYRTIRDGHDVHLDAATLSAGLVATNAEAEASRDRALFARAESVDIASDEQRAIEQWRNGNAREAQALAQHNADRLSALNQAAPSPALAHQAAQYAADNQAFGSLSAGSEAGRSYGLRANATNHHHYSAVSF